MEKIKTMQQTTFPIPDYEAWKQGAEKTLKGKPFEKLFTTTYEGITLKPLYTQKEIENLSYLNDLPGYPTFLRGTDLVGYQKSPWKITQQLVFQSPDKFNESLKQDLARGVTMIHPVLKENIDNYFSSTQFKAAFVDIDLEKYPIFIDAQECSLPVLATFIAAIKESHDITALTGTIGMDPLGGILDAGSSPIKLEQLYELMANMITWANEHTPNLRTVLIKSDPYHNGGANAVQELAIAISTGVEYINQMIQRGLSIDDVAPHVTFSFSIGSNIFMEIAKLRAAKVLWSTVINEFGGNVESQKINIHAQTSTFTKTVYDPYVNILRGTTEAFAAIIGGINSLSITPFDEATGQVDNFSRRVARNIQIILKEEVYLDKVIDPAGGSWYVESLTNEVAEKAWSLFQEIENVGGITQALQEGLIQQIVSDVLKTKLRNLNHRLDKKVGINFYANLMEQSIKMKELNEKVALNIEENNSDLHELKEALSENENIIDKAILAASNGVPINALYKTLFDGLESTSFDPILQTRLTEQFESLRVASESYKATRGHLPRVGLINIGPLSMHIARADFVTGFFEAGGFDVVNHEGGNSIEEIIGALSHSLDVYIICGQDEHYVDFVPEITAILKNKKVFVAGKQTADLKKQFIDAGIAGFIHMKSNCFEILMELQQEMGVY